MRDPPMDLDEEAVWNTLEVLRAGGLITRLLPGGTSRVERFKHEAKEYFGWEKPQRAVMAELLLRGPQTLGELRSHCVRLYPFDSTEAVAAVLESLSAGPAPRVATLPRAPGQAAVRYAHQLYPPQERAQWSNVLGGGAEQAVQPDRQPAAKEELEDLRAAVRELRTDIAELRAAVTELQTFARK